MGFMDMREKAGTDTLKVKEAQQKNTQAEAAAGLKKSLYWRYFEREFLHREKLLADKDSMDKEGKERWKAQGVRELLERMELWFSTKLSQRVPREEMKELKTLASGQQ